LEGRSALPGSKRLLALRADEHLVERIRRGDEAAFEVVYERHVPGVLSFCRHMLGSQEEAEDAVQHTFTSAHSALLRDERDIRLKPWLYTIARNRCLSILRARREQPDDRIETSTVGLDSEVERRAELRQLVEDLQDLPEDQREALVLSELRDLSHQEVADVLGCKVANVKGLVFRARMGLSERREARDASCEAIQQELATVQGGSLRRGRLRHHLRVCAPCTAYLDDVRHQRKMMAAILPVIPTAGLKSSVFAATGIGGGAAAAGGGAVAGGSAAAGGGILGSLTTVGGATVAKVAVVGALAVGGGGFVGQAALDNAGPFSDESPAANERVPAGVPAGPPIGTSEPAAAKRGDAAGRQSQEKKAERKAEKLARKTKKAEKRRALARGRPQGTPAAPERRRGSPSKPAKVKPKLVAPKAGAPLLRPVPRRPTTPARRPDGTVVPPRVVPLPPEPPVTTPRRSPPAP
jgi:RNA polymerase sigma factor (sigma-70 family)